MAGTKHGMTESSEASASSDWALVVKKKGSTTKRTLTALEIGRRSKFQLYVTNAKSMSARELTQLFSRFGELSEPVVLVPHSRGAAFVKFRTRAAANAAVDGQGDFQGDWLCPACSNRNFRRRAQCNRCKHPKRDGGLGLTVDYLDLDGGKHPEWRREKERQLMNIEVAVIESQPASPSSSLASDEALSEAPTVYTPIASTHSDAGLSQSLVSCLWRSSSVPARRTAGLFPFVVAGGFPLPCDEHFADLDSAPGQVRPCVRWLGVDLMRAL